MIQRKKKFIKAKLQAYLIKHFLLGAFTIVMATASLWYFILARLAAELPNDSAMVLSHFPMLMLAAVGLSILFFTPVLVWLGVLVTFRVAGPIYRMEMFLRQIISGERADDCRLRKDDKLHDFCALLNEATRPLRKEPVEEGADFEVAEPLEDVDMLDDVENFDVVESLDDVDSLKR
jgi:hypothetical protein